MTIMFLTNKQWLNSKYPIIDNCLNDIFSLFNTLNIELTPGFHLVNNFSDCFSFISQKYFKALTTYHNKLDNVYKYSLINQNTVLIIADSIKNNIAISISHICRGQEIITKSIHHTMNMTSTKAKLFAIRCSINHAIHLQNFTQIVVITDAILAAKQNFNLSVYLYQLYSIAILKDLKEFFTTNSDNFIVF